MLATKGQSFDGKKVVVSGSGNVALYTIEKVQSFGGKVMAVSDSSGYIVDESGIDLALLKEIKEVRRGRMSDYLRAKGKGVYFVNADAGSIWDVPCDVAMPSATQNELTGKDARKLVANGVTAVGEGANMPLHARCHPHLPGSRRSVRTGQGRQCRRRSDVRARNAAKRIPRQLDIRPDRGSPCHHHAQHPRRMRRNSRRIRCAG